MRRHRYISVLIYALLITAGCATSSASRAETPPISSAPITQIAGSSAATPMLEALTTSYRAQNSESVFELRGGGSRLGETQVFAGEVDLALSTLFVAPASLRITTTSTVSGTTVSGTTVSGTTVSETTITDTTRAQESATELMRTPIALSALAIIVHADSPLAYLSLEQLQQLYSGRAATWQELSLEQSAGAVQLISREEASGARMLFDERVLRGERLSLTALIAPTNAAVVEMVGANRAAIGYVDQAYVRHLLPIADPQARADSPVQVVAVDGLLPMQDEIASQMYPLIYPLYLVYRTPRPAHVDEFVTWVTGQQAQGIVGQFHVLPR